MSSKSTFLLLAFIGCLISCGTSTAQYEPLDSYLSGMYDLKKYTGTLLLGSNDKVLYESAVGPASADGSVMNADKTAYRIGSITKTFTAVLVLQHVESGSLSLEDVLAKWHPEVKNAKLITVRHLLSHTSGIPSYTEHPEIESWKYSENTHAQIIDRFKDLPVEFAPGERFKYSNSNYFLLGSILERVNSGKPYESLLKEGIITPLGMRNTGIESSEKNTTLAEGLMPTASSWEKVPMVHLSVPYAAGALFSTANDMHTFSTALFSGKLFKNAATLELMKTPVKDGYGFGLYELEAAGIKGIGHNGGIDGYSASWMYFPELGLHLVSLSNSFISDHDPLAEAAVKVHLGQDIDMPQARTSVQVAPEILNRYTGGYALEGGFFLNVEVGADGLTCQVPGQSRVDLSAASDSSFFSEIYNLDISFHLNGAGEVTHLILQQAGMNIKGTPYNLPDQMIELSTAQLERLVGVYEIHAGFDLTITAVDGSLMAQATGQPPFPLIAESDTRFFATAAPIDIQFEMGDDGKAKALTLKQAGQVVYAERK